MWFSRFVRHSGGSVMPLFALAVIPVLGLIGASVDYSRAAAARSKLQASLDAALLAGVKDGSAGWSDVATAVFNADMTGMGLAAAIPSFTSDANGRYSATVSASVSTMFLTVMSMSSINVAAASVALASTPENSCILSYDNGKALSDVGMNFGGAPSILLAGCGVRSNTSLSCNGHNGGATASIAAGSATGCSNPHSYARVVPDIYAALASNITTQCGLLHPGLTWNAGVPTVPTAVKVVTKTNYTEYHVCGDLTLSGTGTLISSAPTADSVIVIENGGLTLANSAAVSTLRTAIVLTGSGTSPAVIDFPNGNGQSATLNLSPPTTTGNPWQGVAIYQDPRQTSFVADKWGPGATFNADGLVYLPRADITMSGIAASGNYHCTKFATNTFDTNGNVNLNFGQDSGGCNTVGLKQWNEVPLHLAQ